MQIDIYNACMKIRQYIHLYSQIRPMIRLTIYVISLNYFAVYVMYALVMWWHAYSNCKFLVNFFRCHLIVQFNVSNFHKSLPTSMFDTIIGCPDFYECMSWINIILWKMHSRIFFGSRIWLLHMISLIKVSIAHKLLSIKIWYTCVQSLNSILRKINIKPVHIIRIITI